MKVFRFVLYVGCVVIITFGLLGCEHSGDEDTGIILPGADLLQAAGDLGDAVIVPLEVPTDFEELSVNFEDLPVDREDIPVDFEDTTIEENPDRIVGGRPASIRKWRSMAALAIYRSGGTYLCGGTLINKYWVLTAAHCIPAGTRSVRVNLGSSDRRRPKESIWASLGVTHARYNRPRFDNDIALLKLSKASKQPITPYNAPANLNRKKGRVAGWGLTTARPPSKPPSGSSSNVLREVTVPITTNTICRKVYGSTVTNNMLCAGYKKGGKGSCQGDSGGPMIVGKNVVGIVSWGAGCAWRGYYGVYTRVSRYKRWIKAALKKF